MPHNHAHSAHRQVCEIAAPSAAKPIGVAAHGGANRPAPFSFTGYGTPDNARTERGQKQRAQGVLVVNGARWLDGGAAAEYRVGQTGENTVSERGN